MGEGAPPLISCSDSPLEASGSALSCESNAVQYRWTISQPCLHPSKKCWLAPIVAKVVTFLVCGAFCVLLQDFVTSGNERFFARMPSPEFGSILSGFVRRVLEIVAHLWDVDQ